MLLNDVYIVCQSSPAFDFMYVNSPGLSQKSIETIMQDMWRSIILVYLIRRSVGSLLTVSNKGYLSPGSGNWFASRILCRETPDLLLAMLQLSLVILATGSITTQTRATKLKTKMSGGG